MIIKDGDDITVTIDSESFRCQRQLLAQNSEYFGGLLNFSQNDKLLIKTDLNQFITSQELSC